MESWEREKAERRIARAERIVARRTERLAALNQEPLTTSSETLLAYRNILRNLLRSIILLNRVSELPLVRHPTEPTPPAIDVPDEQQGAGKVTKQRREQILDTANPFAQFDREPAAIPRQPGQPTPQEAVARSASIDAQVANLDRLKRARMAAIATKTASGRRRTAAS